MATLLHRSRWVIIATVVALSITLLSGFAVPLLDSELSSLFSIDSELLIAESDNAGG
jgi:hypothetical protein